MCAAAREFAGRSRARRDRDTGGQGLRGARPGRFCGNCGKPVMKKEHPTISRGAGVCFERRCVVARGEAGRVGIGTWEVRDCAARVRGGFSGATGERPEGEKRILFARAWQGVVSFRGDVLAAHGLRAPAHDFAHQHGWCRLAEFCARRSGFLCATGRVWYNRRNDRDMEEALWKGKRCCAS